MGFMSAGEADSKFIEQLAINIQTGGVVQTATKSLLKDLMKTDLKQTILDIAKEELKKWSKP